MVKYTKEPLLKNKMVVHISDCGLYAICKCEKVIKLKRPYDESYFESHINNNGCNFSNRVISILNFFSTVPKENNQPVMKQFPCTGLNNSEHKAYISHVITYTTHGRAPRKDIVARNLFSTKFTSNKPVVYKKLSEEELNLLDEELIH
ncbi:hypothetical protein F8M41_021605 [Gigaspora margarita]|uniref:Uncharacterized protein n=1 Tax=Gigaspora margarita TaxID=4874 RepID=A0A8H4AGG9_GIGMA|nr:hypothetical protein F8M41_021605 [Gigaspora margarita]